MNIQPVFETQSLSLLQQATQVVKLKSKIVSDPKGVISPGVYKIVRWEKFNQSLILTLGILALVAGFILTLCYAFKIIPTTSWAAYIMTTILILISIMTIANSALKLRWVTKSVEIYRDNIDGHFTHTPPFIIGLFKKYQTNQVGHNWIYFMTMFYGTILITLFWLLKDSSWWILTFDVWIEQLFPNKALAFGLAFGSLAFITLHYIVVSIQRKKHIYDFEMYYGQEIISSKDIEEIKQIKNKFFRRIFYISLIVVFLVPFLILLLVRSILRVGLAKRRA